MIKVMMGNIHYLERTLGPSLRRAASQFPAVVLTGPRQSGKTTLVRHTFEQTHSYCSLDDPLVRQLAVDDPNLLLARFPPPVILDEIQYAPDLLASVKLDIDRHRDQAGRFILTGSQAFPLMAGVTESLAGRAAVLTLLSFSPREVGGAAVPDAGESWRERLEKGSPLGWGLGEVERYLWRGGYPDPALRESMDVPLWHGSYVSTYLERDVRSLRNVGSLSDFRRLLVALAVRSGSLINYADLSRDIGVSAKTVKAWVSVLETSSQVTVLRPWHTNVGKRLVKSPKVYFQDPGTLSWLLGVARPEDALSGMAAGPVLESAVLASLTRMLAHRGVRPSLWFWRTAAGHEVDVVVEDGLRLVPIEVKLTATPRRAQAAALERFLDLFPGRAERGYLVCLVSERTPLTPRVEAVPFDVLG